MNVAAGEPPRPAAPARLVALLRTAARLDRTQSDPVVSFRNAVGVAAPLAIGLLAGNAAFGLPSTIGALQTAFADRPGPYRLRLLRMSGTAIAAAVTSALAVVASRSDLGSAALLLALGLGAGLLLTGGPSASQVGVASTAAALIIGHLPQSPAAAVHVGLLILAGGAGQVVLAIAAWPSGRHRPERSALSGLYRELAGAARRPPGTAAALPASVSLTAVRQVLYGLGHDHGPSVEAYRVLLDEGERIRRELLTLAAYAERRSAEGGEQDAASIRAALGAAADVLDGLAESLADGTAADRQLLVAAHEQLRTAIARLDRSQEGLGALTRRAAVARLRALSGQLRAAIETTRTGASEGGTGEEPDTYGARRLRDPVAIVRANLTPTSAVLRHAIRVGVLVAGSDLVVRLAGVDRGYWIPLTVLVVLRPDFASTFQRSSMRVLGTVVGLLLATELVHWVPGGQWYRIALVAVFFFGMRFAGPGNLGLSAVSLAALVVVLLAFAGVPPHTTVVRRGVDTLIGGALALLASLLSPLWERQLVRARLGDLLDAYGAYLAAVADPGADLARRQRTRAASRLARTNAQASVDRARSEPVRAHAEVELGEGVLAHSHRFVHGVLTIDALRPTLHHVADLDVFGEFVRLAGEVLGACAAATRSGAGPRSIAALRPAQERLAEVVLRDPSRVGDPATAAALVDATDRITNSLDTLVDELRRQGDVATPLTSSE